GTFFGMSVSGNSNVVKGNMISSLAGGDNGITVAGQMNTISSNIIKNNHGNGIGLFQASGNTISGNLIMNNDGDGIHVAATSSNNTTRGNTAMGNGEALGGFDLEDDTPGGTGTAGTKNTWSGNKAKTRSPAGLL